MQATTPGHNRTGAALSPDQVKEMLEAVDELSPHVPISTAPMDADRLLYIADADSVGSIPPPASMLKGTVKKTIALMNGISPSLFLDKLGERIGFERTGTRVYDAMISKYLAVRDTTGAGLPPYSEVASDGLDGDAPGLSLAGEAPIDTLRRIRDEEHQHFLMLCEAMTQLGGDPTAVTPCADVAATATMGVLQVITDPRTTLAQCLNALLITELTDTASWELLSEMAIRAGQDELAPRFLAALDAEEMHLRVVRSWLRALTLDGAGTPAV